jgi:hypothetical protein
MTCINACAPIISEERAISERMEAVRKRKLMIEHAWQSLSSTKRVDLCHKGLV